MHEASIALLNQAVADELSAVHQYMYYHFHCDDQGYEALGALFRRTAIEEMLHAEQFAERILFLGGDVNMAPDLEFKSIQDVKEMLLDARSSEEGAIGDYNRRAIECANNADSVTRTLFESVVADEERHYDQFDNEIQNLERFGDQYLALQSMERGGLSTAGGE